MRPIRLEFAGLQSYREVQALDFAELLGGGLFGIFGPTGAGKSTILDAITLALYGRVERAKGTFGIMNQGERRLWVKFTFSLGSDRYRVERSYKREKETESIRSEHARLIRIGGGGAPGVESGQGAGQVAGAEAVLADKERDVNQQVTEILGLQLDDFTRAVVLPQGQFAEFLQLKGADRTRMLQRIFTLDQYGDQLTARLKRRVERVTGQLTRVQGEQTGLGDASAEAVAQAEAQLREAEASALAAEQELTALEAQFRDWERLWEVQQELAAVAEGIARWRDRLGEAESYRAELAAARRAEQVRPHLAAQRQAELQAEQAAGRLAQAEQALARAQAAEQQAVAAHEAARAQRAQEGPALTERRLRLQQAIGLESTLAEARERLADLAERVARGEQLTASVASRIVAGESQLAAFTGEEQGLRGRLEAVTIDAEERSRIQEARRRLDRLREAERGLSDAVNRLEGRRQLAVQARTAAEASRTQHDTAGAALTAQEREIARLEAEPPADEAELQQGAVWLSRAEEQIRAVAEAAAQVDQRQEERSSREAEASRLKAEAEDAAAAESRLRQALDRARQGLEGRRAELEEANRHEHAVALIQSLIPGDPCPVCGSTEHPRPATPEATVDPAAARLAYQQAELAVEQAQQSLELAFRHRIDAEGRFAGAERMAGEAAEAVARAQAQLQAARGRLPSAWSTLQVNALPEALRREAAEQADRRQRYQAWLERLTTLRRGRDDQGRIVAAAAAEVSAREATLQAALESLAESEGEVAAQGRLVDQRRSEFDQLRGDHEAAGIEAAQQRMEAADREAGRLRSELDELRQAQQAQEQALAEDRRKHQEYLGLLHQRQIERAQAEQRFIEADLQWRVLTGGEAAGPQLAAVEGRISALEQAEGDSAAARELAERERGRAGAHQAACLREQELGAERLTEARAGLDQALTAAAFTGAEAAAAALRSPDRQAELERALGEYEREGDRLQSREAVLMAQANGRRLTADEWQSWQERRTSARSAAAERRDQRTRAEQIRSDLLAKQRRWQELEEQRQTLTTSLNHLEELRALLRGNSFVDFLAEEQMSRVAAEASSRLGQLTRHRYALESEAGGGFIIRDDGNGGARRAVTTLSGGETFLTSLSLALALSAQIQLRGHYPLEFFFLDEGFGTLDPDLLDVVISTLERLHFENLHVGVISHVPELRSRLQRRVIVEPAEAGGRGSRVRLERA